MSNVSSDSKPSNAANLITGILIIIVFISLFVCLISRCSSSGPIDRDEFCRDMERAYNSAMRRGATERASEFLEAMRKAGCR